MFVTTTEIMANISIQLGGNNWHHFFVLQLKKISSYDHRIGNRKKFKRSSEVGNSEETQYSIMRKYRTSSVRVPVYDLNHIV